MKRLVLPALAMAAMLVTGTPHTAYCEGASFGIVNLGKLYQESQLGKAAMSRSEALQGAALASVQEMQGKLEKARADKKTDEVAKLEKDLQERVYFMQNQIKKDQEHIMQVIQAATQKAFDAYRKENKLAAIFCESSSQGPVVLSYDSSVDVTAGVQAIMDKEPADYGEVPTLEMPARPEPANATPKPAEGEADKQ